MACVDENVIAAYFDFKLSSREANRLFEHVDACVACTHLLDASTVSHAMRSGTATPGGATGAIGGDCRPPATTLGRYHVERVVGIGGMGVVYAGHDPELDRKVAIKLLLPDAHLDPGTLRSRLKQEAQAMARLSHPNVISVYDVGSWGDQVFLVMELVEGSTLSDWLRAGPRGWREILGVFLAAGAGLDAAHRAGIIHRDFKPDNVLVSRTQRICVTDFGLAHRLEDASDAYRAIPPLGPQGTAVIQNGLLIGTPAYMAPEQIRGEPTDPRADLFSFCVALYEALYGTR
ncbi:MAG TPA: serine/threonine-protein kinase, partial [Kofleriaceae bacterium]